MKLRSLCIVLTLTSISYINIHAADASTFVAAVTTLKQTYPSITKQNVAAAIPAITNILSTYGSLVLPATQEVKSALFTLATLYLDTWSGHTGWKQADRELLTTAYKNAGIQSWLGDARWEVVQQASNYFQSTTDNVALIKTFVSALNSWSLTQVNDFGSFCTNYGYSKYEFIADIEADDSTPENKKWIAQPFIDKLVQAIERADDPGQFRLFVSNLKSTCFFLRNYATTIDGLPRFIDNCIANKPSLNFIGATFEQTSANLNEALNSVRTLTFLTAISRDVPLAFNQVTTLNDCKNYIDIVFRSSGSYLGKNIAINLINQTKEKIIAHINAATTVNDIIATLEKVTPLVIIASNGFKVSPTNISVSIGKIGNEWVEVIMNKYNIALGTASLTALTKAVRLATPTQYQAIKNITTQVAATFTLVSFTSIFTTIEKNLNAIENNLNAKLGVKNFDQLKGAIEATLSITPSNQARVGAALLKAFSTASSLVTTPEAGVILSQLFATATNKKATYFTPSQQTSLDKLTKSFTSRYNQIVREQKLANPPATDLAQLCTALAAAIAITKPVYSKFSDDLLTTFERAAKLAETNLTAAISAYKSAKTRRDIQGAKQLSDKTIAALFKSTNSLKKLLSQARAKIAGINKNRVNTIGMKLDKLSKMKLQ